jgi:hypothetical protein
MSTALAQKTKKRSANNKCTFVEKDAVNDRDFWFPENPSMNQIRAQGACPPVHVRNYLNTMTELFGINWQLVERFEDDINNNSR